MDLLQKHGHMKRDKRDSQEQRQTADTEHQQTQQAVNSLLGNFGHAKNDHPDRRSSGAGNMGEALQRVKEETRNSTSDMVERRE